MVSLKSCFVHIPALPNIITVSGVQEIAKFGYATTNTNYLGFTSCAVSSRNTPTALGQQFSTAKCTLPASVSGKAYSVTPVVVFTGSGSFPRTTRSCDPVPVASLNKANFQFSCKTVAVNKLEVGYHTISWQVPAAASVSIIYNLFPIVKPSTTPVYVVSPAKASTTFIPVTATYTTATSTRPYTIATPTSWVRIYTDTKTCSFTVTVTPTAAPLIRRQEDEVRGVPGSDLQPELLPPASPDTDPQHDLLPHAPIDLKKRAATPTLAKIDFTYPPYGKSTVYVKSFSTTTYTWWTHPVSTVTPPGVTITTSIMSYSYTTLTVTKTPTATTAK
ncbi:hypothetical protein B0T14DRAFT_438868 [Immersiella caudata]|uniref:Uncharacterized protein n=1 Tax=Immersiella caudata TaxID=314043 RepID=A0AA39WEL8_9PEZI|nr:hypothetical protein B0T14DRAFT_438868 [Immersiella caudata]